MEKIVVAVRTFFSCITMCLLLAGICSNVVAQQVIGLSVGYEYFPSAELVDPIEGAEDFEIQTSSRNIGASFPLSFANGKILLLNQIGYKRVDFCYRNFPEGGTQIEQAQSIKYTFFMLDSLSQKWSLVAVLTPGLASDFEGKVTSDDFTFEGVFGFIRKFSKNFSLGAGAAYIRDFGKPLPLPFIYFDWSNGSNLSATGIVPNNIDLLYKLNPQIDLGLSLKIGGNRYHGDPDRFDVNNPQMEYSEGTVSPMAQLYILEWLHLNVEGGFAFYRNFEFLDGDDVKESYDLEQTGYLRAGLVLGM